VVASGSRTMIDCSLSSCIVGFHQSCQVLTIIRPETLARWHRAGFRCYWRWKSRPQGGRPQIDTELRRLVRRMSVENPLWGCAVKRRRFPVGVSPTRQPLQPVATGAVMEVTKWLKPLVSVSRYTVTAQCAGRNASERRANLEKGNAQADPNPFSGKADTAGLPSETIHPAAAPGYWRQHVHKESVRNTGDPKAWSGMTNRKPVRDRPGALGRRRGSLY
jgi:hypothetical protein